jgi:mannose-6-phosphate isomerase-like protein (cupin superfamily)
MVTGEFDDSAAGEHPTITRMMQDVLEHGEVHARWADSDEYVEVRQGTATFDFEGEVVLIDDGITTHTFSMGQVVS